MGWAKSQDYFFSLHYSPSFMQCICTSGSQVWTAMTLKQTKHVDSTTPSMTETLHSTIEPIIARIARPLENSLNQWVRLSWKSGGPWAVMPPCYPSDHQQGSSHGFLLSENVGEHLHNTSKCHLSQLIFPGKKYKTNFWCVYHPIPIPAYGKGPGKAPFFGPGRVIGP